MGVKHLEGETENVAADEAFIQLAPVLNLPAVDTEQMEPHALGRYLEFLHELYKQVPDLYLIVDEDLRLFLSETEYSKFNPCVKEITDWLEKCKKDNDGATLKVYPYHSPFSAMSDLQKLLKAVHERKLLRERRVAALVEIDPPYKDAEKYLSQQEHASFLGTLAGAADSFLEGGAGCPLGDWRLGDGAIHFSGFMLTIKERRKEKARQKQAQLEHDQFFKKIDDSVKKMKQRLTEEKKPSFVYPTWLAGYHPDLWCEAALPTEQQIKDWARPQIKERVPQALREFVRWVISWEMLAEPDAKYEVIDSLPCLTWCFTAFILIKVHLKLVGKKFTKVFCGYEYPMEIEGEGLGTFYLGPVLGGRRKGLALPIALIALLGKNGLESPGIEVVEHGSPFTTFTIQGFEEEVQIHEGFCRFIADMGKDGDLPDALLAKHVVDQVTATLMKEKANLPLPQPVSTQASPGGNALDNSDVKAALEVMGFKGMEIKAGIEAAHLSPGMTFEEKLTAVLKNMGG